jgi:hypothetical protein
MDFASSATKKGQRVFQCPELKGKQPVDTPNKQKMMVVWLVFGRTKAYCYIYLSSLDIVSDIGASSYFYTSIDFSRDIN